MTRLTIKLNQVLVLAIIYLTNSIISDSASNGIGITKKLITSNLK